MMKAGNDVTVLARGEWKETLEKSGLVIRHWAQMRTSVDRPKLTEELKPTDVYDIIFVVVQFTQLDAVLPLVAADASRRVALVGNNPDA